MIRVSVVGATGYTGVELIRYLLRHPQAEIVHCTSESYAGKPVSAVYPDLCGKFEQVTEKLDVARIALDSDLVFLCLPHAESARTAQQFLKKKVKVVDLSADFRLKSGAVYQKWYGIRHPCPELLRSAVYGLPEIYREKVAGADLVANPGCYATTTILSLLPLVRSGAAREKSWVVDAKSGVSGAGRKAETRYLFCEDNENFLAYAVVKHRHVPEIEQVLNDAGEPRSQVSLSFVPHLLPINRGILVTAYADLKKRMTSASLRSMYAEFYKGEPFLVVLPEGQFPEVRSVQNSNYCQIGVRVDERNNRAVIIGVLDNLGKGASSQAIQNMNLMFGLEETAGLR